MRIRTRVPRGIDPKPSNFRKIYIILNLYVGLDRRSRSAKRPAGRPVDTGPRSTPRPGSILSEKCDQMAIEVRWPMILLTREPEHCWSRRTAVPATIIQSLPRERITARCGPCGTLCSSSPGFCGTISPYGQLHCILSYPENIDFLIIFRYRDRGLPVAGVASDGNRARRQARNHARTALVRREYDRLVYTRT